MGLLSDKMNEDFDRRIEIAEELGIDVHSTKMMVFQLAKEFRDIKITKEDLKDKDFKQAVLNAIACIR